jgi:anhydro-N-acetylmuramic acid kinase
MSGTSLDGIDVADVDCQWGPLRLDARLLHLTTVPLGASLRAAIVEALPPRDGSTACVAELNYALGEAFADAVLLALREWGVDSSDIDVIGSHGQTLYHAPADGVTLQVGEAAVIAARTGITCVADFRAADIAAGGKGATLVPFVDYQLFSSDAEHRAVLNIGGIANVTLLPRGGAAADARAFDTGPGNMVVDECVRTATEGRRNFDTDGTLARSGRVSEALLDELLSHEFFRTKPPKSTGREEFGSAYAQGVWRRGLELHLRAEDIIATVTALTARSIACSIPDACDRIIASGGGARNQTLMAMLSAELGRRSTRAVLEPSDRHGIPVDAKEALAFAVLGCERICGRTNHLPQCTGARTCVILGKLSPGSNYERLISKLLAGESAR